MTADNSIHISSFRVTDKKIRDAFFKHQVRPRQLEIFSDDKLSLVKEIKSISVLTTSCMLVTQEWHSPDLVYQILLKHFGNRAKYRLCKHLIDLSTYESFMISISIESLIKLLTRYHIQYDGKTLTSCELLTPNYNNYNLNHI